RGSSVTVNATWKNAGLPFVATNHIYVQGTSPVLTIQPGVTVKFNQNVVLYVGYNPTSATLQAVGTAASPITFTANTASPSPGFWGGINLSTSTAASTQISYATVSYAGGTGGGIAVNGCSPTISNVTVQNNSQFGVYVNNGSPTISSLTATAN